MPDPISEPASTTAPDEDGSYFASVVAEIEAEAARRSQAGEYPRELLRSLDEEFRRWIPDGSREHGIEDSIRAIEAAAYVDAGVPVDSNRRIGRYVKTGVRKATYFYHRHIAQQVTSLGIHITRPLRLLDAAVKGLDGRVKSLEQAGDVNAGFRQELLAAFEPPELDDQMAEVVTSHLVTADGRVLVGECMDNSLLATLCETGISAYGVGPAGDNDGTLEVRNDPLEEHLENLNENTLAGAILVGVSDKLALNELLHTLHHVTRVLKPGARLAVIATSPAAWDDALGHIASDLLGHRPLHSDTWRHLLTRAGATDTAVTTSADDSCSVITATLPGDSADPHMTET
jgi:hypothetical protein